MDDIPTRNSSRPIIWSSIRVIDPIERVNWANHTTVLSSNIIKMRSLPCHQCHFSETMKTCHVGMSRVMTRQHMPCQLVVSSSKISHVDGHYYVFDWCVLRRPATVGGDLYTIGIAIYNCFFRYHGVAGFPIFRSVDNKTNILCDLKLKIFVLEISDNYIKFPNSKTDLRIQENIEKKVKKKL